MSEIKEKSACRAGTPTAEKENLNNSILADGGPIVKCAVATKELNAYQKSVIRRIYYMSHERHSLVSNLKKLQFCTYSVALKYLKEQELIDNEDYYSLMKEV